MTAVFLAWFCLRLAKVGLIYPYGLEIVFGISGGHVCSVWFLLEVWVDVKVACDLFLLQLESSVVITSIMKPHVSLDVSSVAFFYLQNNSIPNNWEVMHQVCLSPSALFCSLVMLVL